MNRVKKLIIAAGILGMALNSINAQNNAEPIIKSNPKVVVLFYKPGCSFYQYIAPLFSTLTNEYKTTNPDQKVPKKIVFTAIDISGQDGVYKGAYHFSTVPTVIYFKQGAPALSHGSNNKTITVDQMKNNIKSVFNI